MRASLQRLRNSSAFTTAVDRVAEAAELRGFVWLPDLVSPLCF